MSKEFGVYANVQEKIDDEVILYSGKEYRSKYDLRVNKPTGLKVDYSKIRKEPYSYACFVNLQEVDVFVITGLFDCEEVAFGTANAKYSTSYLKTHPQLSNFDKITPTLPTEAIAQQILPEGGLQPTQTQQALSQEENQALQKLASEFKTQKLQEKCALISTNWAYIEGECVNKLAEGKGVAINADGLRYEGSFKAGQRVDGEIYQNGEMIFAGQLVEDKPHGEALCLYEGEYEECRFYKGKRIDSLYKIRLEIAKQTEQNERLARQNMVKNSSSTTNLVVDAVKKEGAKRAATYLFDRLF